ncbi:MAG: cupin domain-containing protein [Anaerolineae bacterium]|nr:cupin domain-containing protein [Anaerolineae bacterium]NIN99878.1 cupin domain-containing protein [Anaerolineae bacterium]NIQ82655.1 cupin domain-containing protein [Anaerolineae bacterium]
MNKSEVHLQSAADMRAEESGSAFAALLREKGDEIRRDVFLMLAPEQTASGRLQVGYTVIYPGCTTRGHEHTDREEVYYFTKGCGVMIVDGSEYEVAAGDTFYIKPGPFHTTRNTTDFPFEFFWITIKVD